jgi:Protein of unknown function (DUF2004)
MAKYTLIHFGEIDMEHLNDIYETTINFNNRVVVADIIFDEDSVTENKMAAIHIFLNDIEKFHEMAINAIKNDVETDGAVSSYINHHIETLDENELSKIINQGNVTDSKETKLLAAFYLKRIGFYPDDESQFAVFDYTIGTHVTNYLIAVNFAKGGKIVNLAMES